MAGGTDDRETPGGAVKERTKDKTQEPTLYNVVLLNDDYTPMQFVVDVLESIFQRSPAEAYRIMMQVHVNGKGLAGMYPWDVAETKVDKLTTLARESGHPLQAMIEES
ncbi:MAG TPA: ATP-dependent Clp protease adapter ClpS [Vicinamibacterales bacterium]|jgi:ATP-dependent Clp protease adaptor protein ClpS|nr:ATP-dependent Clp protease adapter ClpS [Vicinamibacterales bacterium]